MVEVTVGGMVMDKKSGSPVLLLKVPDSARYLPIWIGPAEANAIAMVLSKRSFERPLTHDLLKQVVDGLDGTVTRVVITSLKENTFFAKIFLSRGNEVVSIDARPSDSVALALRAKCPIFVSDELLANQVGNLLEIEEEQQQAKESAVEDLIRDIQLGQGPGRPEEDDEDDDEEGGGG